MTEKALSRDRMSLSYGVQKHIATGQKMSGGTTNNMVS